MSGITTQIQKEKTESILKRITEGSDYTFKTNNAINTPVKCDGRVILDIYYRKAEIRIDIHINSFQYTKNKQLRAEGVTYQKVTANPEGRGDIYALFVSEENAEYALKVLLDL